MMDGRVDQNLSSLWIYFVCCSSCLLHFGSSCSANFFTILSLRLSLLQVVVVFLLSSPFWVTINGMWGCQLGVYDPLTAFYFSEFFSSIICLCLKMNFNWNLVEQNVTLLVTTVLVTIHVAKCTGHWNQKQCYLWKRYILFGGRSHKLLCGTPKMLRASADFRDCCYCESDPFVSSRVWYSSQCPV